MFLVVAEAESTRRGCKPVEVCWLLVVNGGSPPHILINVRPMHTGGNGDVARCGPWFLWQTGKRLEKCDVTLKKMKSELIERTTHLLALQQLYF